MVTGLVSEWVAAESQGWVILGLRGIDRHLVPCCCDKSLPVFFLHRAMILRPGSHTKRSLAASEEQIRFAILVASR